MVGSRVTYRIHKRSSVERYDKKKHCFKRIFKGVVFPPSGSAGANDGLQGHIRERVQLCLAQSLNKDIAGELEQRGCEGGREVGCEKPCGMGPCHTDERSSLGRRLQDLAWFTLFFFF